MVQELYEKYIFLYVIGGLCGVGVLLKCFLLVVYNKLIRASESMATTKKLWMKNMKLRFETSYQLKIGVNDVDTFVDKYVSKTKYGGLLLSTWENLSGQTLYLCLLVGSFAGILGALYDCGKGPILFTTFTGLWAAVIVNIVDNIVNISGHKQVLRYNLKDYFENYLKVRMEQEVYRSESYTKYQEDRGAAAPALTVQDRTPLADAATTTDDNIDFERDCYGRWESKHAAKVEAKNERLRERLHQEEQERILRRNRESEAAPEMTRKEKKEKAKMDALLEKQNAKKEKEDAKRAKEQSKLDAIQAKEQKKLEKEAMIEKAKEDKKQAKIDQANAKITEKELKKQAKVDAKQAKLDEKQAKIKGKEDAKEAKRQAKEDAVRAKQQEKLEAKKSLQDSKKAMLEAQQAKAMEKKGQTVNRKAQVEKLRLMQEKERQERQRGQAIAASKIESADIEFEEKFTEPKLHSNNGTMKAQINTVELPKAETTSVKLPKAETRRAEPQRVDIRKAERENEEKVKQEKERLERERQEKVKQEKERLERERQEKERQEKERQEKESAEAKRIAMERQEEQKRQETRQKAEEFRKLKEQQRQEEERKARIAKRAAQGRQYSEARRLEQEKNRKKTGTSNAISQDIRDPEDIDDFGPVELTATSKEDDALIEEVLRDFLS